MKTLITLVFLCILAQQVFSQDIKLTGTCFDPNGSLIVTAQIAVIDEKGTKTTGSTDSEGQFEFKVHPGIYSLSVAATGFLTVQYPEFLVVNSTTGKMAQDFVLFGAKYHEPCGVAGSPCLKGLSLIRSYEVTSSPKLKSIRDEFAPESKPKQ